MFLSGCVSSKFVSRVGISNGGRVSSLSLFPELCINHFIACCGKEVAIVVDQGPEIRKMVHWYVWVRVLFVTVGGFHFGYDLG